MKKRRKEEKEEEKQRRKEESKIKLMFDSDIDFILELQANATYHFNAINFQQVCRKYLIE